MPNLNLCSRRASVSLVAAGLAAAFTLWVTPVAQAQPSNWNGNPGPGPQPGMAPPPSAHPGDRGYDRGSRRGPVVRCESNNGRYRECRVPFRGPATLVRQLSDARCIPGRTYGTKRGRIWVSNGCRGEFAPR
jgi:hypothetical protein